MAFPTNTTVLDDFNRADEGPPMTGWTDISNGLQVDTNQCRGNSTGTTVNASLFNGATYGPDVEVFATMATEPADNNDDAGIYARMTTLVVGTADGYFLGYQKKTSGADVWYLARVDNGAATLISAGTTQAVANGNKLGLECVGGQISSYLFNGTSWAQIETAADATYGSAGYVGLNIEDTEGRWDDLSGGARIAAAAAVKDLINGGILAFTR